MAFLLVDMAAIYFKYLKILFFELIIIHMVQNSKDKKKRFKKFKHKDVIFIY